MHYASIDICMKPTIIKKIYANLFLSSNKTNLYRYIEFFFDIIPLHRVEPVEQWIDGYDA